MSKPVPDTTLTDLDAAPGAPPGPEGEKHDGVFRLESLSPGSDPDQGLTAPRHSRLADPKVFLSLLVLAGAGVVFGMRQFGLGPAGTIAQVKLPDYDPAASAGKGGGHERVLKDLDTTTSVTQVPPDQVQKNPFKIADVQAVDLSGADPSAAAADRSRKEADARRRAIEAEAARLEIHGILGGSNPVARISGQTVRVGDPVGELFTVKAISGRSVELEADGQTFTISLDEQPGGSRPAAPGRTR